MDDNDGASSGVKVGEVELVLPLCNGVRCFKSHVPANHQHKLNLVPTIYRKMLVLSFKLRHYKS